MNSPPPDTKFGLSREMKNIPSWLLPPEGLTSHKKWREVYFAISNFAQTLATFALKHSFSLWIPQEARNDDSVLVVFLSRLS